MKQQKWSGVKLSKKELEEVKKDEKLELIADFIAFFAITGLIAFCIFAFLFITGGLNG